MGTVDVSSALFHLAFAAGLLTRTCFSQVIIARVVGVHIDDRVLTEGKVDIIKTVPIARCGYWQVSRAVSTSPNVNPLSTARVGKRELALIGSLCFLMRLVCGHSRYL